MEIFDIKTYRLDYPFKYNTEETDELNTLLNHNSNFTLDHLRRVALWKIDRVLNVPEETIIKLQGIVSKKAISIDDSEIEDIIIELTSCSGIGIPMASAILKFLRPDIFPIIDVRAYRALFGKKLYYNSYSVDIYKAYVKKVYEIRDKLKIELYKVDQQLYCFDKEINGNI